MENIKIIRFASTDMRNIYSKNAEDFFNKGLYSESAYFQLESLCFRYDAKNVFKTSTFNKNEEIFLHLQFPPSKKSGSQIQKNSNALVNFAKNKYIADQKIAAQNNIQNVIDPCKEMQNINNFIQSLPKEWNVVQITKGYDPNLTYSTEAQILQFEVPLYFTILKHSRSSEFPYIPPIIIKIEASNKISKAFFDIRQNFKKITTGISLKTNEKVKYYSKLDSIDCEISKAIQDLSDLIGPWCCLLTGNANEKDEKLLQKIFVHVDKFCKEHNLNDTIRILLSILASNPICLTDNNLKKVIEQLPFKNMKNPKIIIDFLRKQKNRIELREPLNPVILILDEFLDHFPWEMLNKNQEICRISSYNILKQLYTKFKSKISKGFLRINVSNGNCIINPEKNLECMEKRMKLFFDYWLPNWNCIYGEMPTPEKIQELFSLSGIYVYCGHGSGMQLLNPYKIGLKEIKKSVVFLFGCESVKLKSAGLHSELYGEHLYFHAGLCPVVIGLIHIGLDFPMDKNLANTLSTWIASAAKPHWHTFDEKQWKKGNLVPSISQSEDGRVEYQQRLSAILCSIRCNPSQRLHNIIGFVYRGLPVWSTNS